MQANTTPSHDTHSVLVGYLCWLFGFTGAHRFYYGKQITGTIWFFTLGLLGVGWLIDLFLIPGMNAKASRPGRPRPGSFCIFLKHKSLHPEQKTDCRQSSSRRSD